MEKSTFGKITILATCALVQPAWADDDISVTAGVRLWSVEWLGNGLEGRSVTHLDSGATTVPILVGSVRYKDFGFSASRFMSTSFTLANANPQATFRTKRVELDLHASYYFLPGLSAGIGYKESDFSGGTVKGPIFSLAGSAPLGSGIGLYANGAIGPLKARFPGANSNANYTLSELGFSYSFDGASLGAMKGWSATLGYRYQSIKLKNFQLFFGQDVRDSTVGTTLGLFARF